MHEHHIARTLTSEEQHRRMLQTPVPKLVLSLAAPTVASQLISIIYNTADTYFVSQISTSASAAVGVVFSLSSIIQAYGFGVAMGASSLISLRLGEKKDRDANGYASSGFFAELVGGLLILIFGLLFLEPLMRVLGATETMLPHACAYGRIILMGAPIMCCSFVLNCVLRAEGAAVVSMVGLCAGGLINIALDPLFIFTFEMGTAGAAIATVASQCVSLMILSISFLRGRSIVHLHPKYVSCHMRDYGQIIAVGFPTIARQGMASLASALMNIQGAIYGDAAVAALTISNKIYLLVRNVMIGIGQGFQPSLATTTARAIESAPARPFSLQRSSEPSSAFWPRGSLPPLQAASSAGSVMTSRSSPSGASRFSMPARPCRSWRTRRLSTSSTSASASSFRRWCWHLYVRASASCRSSSSCRTIWALQACRQRSPRPTFLHFSSVSPSRSHSSASICGTMCDQTFQYRKKQPCRRDESRRAAFLCS